MECICKFCGHKHNSGHLVFDFGQLLEEAGEKMELDIRRKYDIVRNTIREMSEGPAFLSEEELIEKRAIYITKQVFFEKVTRVLKELREIDILIKSRDIVTGENIRECAQMEGRTIERRTTREPLIRLCEALEDSAIADIFAELLNKDLELPEEILNLEVDLLPGVGDIKISRIQDRGKNVIATIRHCPYCNSEMSAISGAYPEIVLTVLGSPRVSKSTTLTACAYQFMEMGAQHSLPISWTIYKDDSDWGQFYNRCYSRYRENLQVEATQRSGHNAIPRFSAMVTINGPYKNKKSEFILTVVDLPGELMGKEGDVEELWKKYSELYQNVDVIWYCTDCAEIKQITDIDALKKLGYEDAEVVKIDEITRTMANLAMIFKDKKIPVAFIMGKGDFLAESYKEEYKICKGGLEGNGKIGYYERNGNELVLEGRKLFQYMEGVRSVFAGVLDQKVRQSFPCHSYMAISGYGHGFYGEESEKPLKPWNTEMPFLWTLAILGYLRVKGYVTKRGLLRGETEEEEFYFADKDEITKLNLSIGGSKAKSAYQKHSVK